MLLVDEDWSKADPAGLPAAGYHAIIGYVSEDTTGKNLTPTDVAAAHRVGLAVGLVYEYATNAALGGAARGTRDAGIAVAHARGLGAPAGVCLYHAVDFQAAAGDMPAILQYALAGQQVCAAAGYRHGIYADYAVCAYLRAHGYTGFLWQTYAWSLGQWFAAAVLRQELNHITIAGAVVDKDEALVDDWGQWEAEMTDFGSGDVNAWHQATRIDALRNMWPKTGLGEDMPIVSTILAMQADLAAVKASGQATAAAFQALTSAGSSIDTAAVMAHIDQVAAAESQAVQGLQQQLADAAARETALQQQVAHLEQQLAAAGHALES